MPTEALAAAIAAEWDALDAEIAPRPPAADPRRQLGDRPGGAAARRRWSTPSPSTAAATCSATAPPRPRRSRRGRPRAGTPGSPGRRATLARAAGRGDRRDAPSRSRRRASPRCAPRWPPQDAFAPRRAARPRRALGLARPRPRGRRRRARRRRRPGTCRASTRPGRPSTGASTPRPRRRRPRRRADFLQARSAPRSARAVGSRDARPAEKTVSDCGRLCGARAERSLDLCGVCPQKWRQGRTRRLRLEASGLRRPDPLPREAAQQEEEPMKKTLCLRNRRRAGARGRRRLGRNPRRRQGPRHAEVRREHRLRRASPSPTPTANGRASTSPSAAPSRRRCSATPTKVEFVPTTGETRFTALTSGEIDVLVAQLHLDLHPRRRPEVHLRRRELLRRPGLHGDQGPRRDLGHSSSTAPRSASRPAPPPS